MMSVPRFYTLAIMICAVTVACTTKSTPEYATVATLAGRGKIGPLGGGYADGPVSEAEFWYPTDIAVGPDVQLYIADWKNHRTGS